MSLTYEESRRRAELLSVHAYDVHLRLSEAETFTVRTVVEFDSREPGAETFIDLVDPLIVTATLNGQPLATDGRNRIVLPELAAHNRLVVEAEMSTVTGGDGMQRFVDPVDGAVYVSAYCGMDIASRIFPCFDQPDLKATLTISVDAPTEWTVLSNGVCLSQQDTTRRFATTPPISSCLFVVCAGTWHSVRWEHAGLPFGWHIRKSLAERLDRDRAELQRITEAYFDHYTSTFTEPYPFDSYDQVLVPQHNWGALETPGCVTFREEYLSRGEPTALQRQGLAAVVAHEMAHMWFGNLVTMVWWEDSWLNESFADFLGYDVAGRAAGFTDTWVACALGRKVTGYLADERRSTHRIAEAPEVVTDVDYAFSNFDMITYAKGNAVLRQLGAWLGEETFLAATNRHLSAHAFGNATLADYLEAMAAVSDRDVRGWAETWLRSTGFDTIRVTREPDGTPVLTRVGSRPHRFTLTAYDGPAARTQWVDLAEQPVRLPDFAGLPVLPNAGDETFARVRVDEDSWRWLSTNLGQIPDQLTRAVGWATAVDMARLGELTGAELVTLAERHLAADPSPALFEGVLTLLGLFLGSAAVAPDPTLTDRLAQVCREVASGPDQRLAAARALAGYSRDQAELDGLLADTTDQDLRWRLILRLIELGGPDSLVGKELEQDPSDDGRLAALSCRAAAPDPAAKRAALVHLLEGTPSNREWTALSAGLWRPGQHELWLPLISELLAKSPEIAEARGQGFSRVVGATFPNRPLPLAHLSQVRDELAHALESPTLPTVLSRAWNDVLDDLTRALTSRS